MHASLTLSSSFSMALFLLLLLLLLISTTITTTTSQSSVCRTACGTIPISHPFGIDPGCGHPHYHHLLSCPSSHLLLRTPSGSYPILRLSYSVDPHIVVSDPSLFSCSHFPPHLPNPPPFSLDSSSPLSLSPKNDLLFFNCSPDSVLIRPKPPFCDRYPDRCDSACDSAAYLCRSLPGCPEKLRRMEMSCCSYFPTASESLRMMLRHCGGGYTSLYWRTEGAGVEQVAEYGIRVDFEVPVTTRCRVCRERGGGGTCGYDVETKEFLCLCNEGNVTTYCGDGRASGSRTSSAGVVAGTTTVVSVAGLGSAGALIWYIRKMRSNKVVTCGVQTTENRLF